MPEYEIRPKINETLRLNVSQGVAADHQAVTISTSTGTNEQKWFVYKVAAGESQAILSTINQAYGLNIKGPTTTDTRLCTLLVAGGNARDSLVSFVSAGTNYWYIKLTNYNYYLTCNGSSDGSGVSWQPFTGGDAQTWRFSHTLPDGPKSYTYMTATYNGMVLHIIRTRSGNIQLQNLLYTKNLEQAGVIGINGGFYEEGNKLLNIAKSDGVYVGTGASPYNGKANSCGNGIIYRETDGTMHFIEGTRADDITAIRDLTGSVSWAQGGAGLYPGYSGWRGENLAFFEDMDNNVALHASRSAMAVDFERDFVYLIITRASVTYGGFRRAIMNFLNVTGTESATDKDILIDRYAGVFLDGGPSSQIRAVDPQNNPVLIPQNGRRMMQIITLRNVT